MKDSTYVIQHRRVFDYRLDFDVTDSQRAVVEAMENGNRVFLKGNATFAMGIVTGDNKTHVKSDADGLEPVYRGSDVMKYRLCSPTSFISFQPEKFQQTADEKIYRKEKLLYRFVSDEPVVAFDGNGSLSLNSCNILIPRFDALSMKYVMAVLNSRAVSFYFRKKFASLKVLRSQLEAIPIPVADAETQRLIQKKTDLLSQKYDEGLINEIDEIIDELYGIG